jgi:hypothetical protein
MLKRSLFIVLLSFFIFLTLCSCSSDNKADSNKADVVVSSRYDDLVSLFREFRKFQEPEWVDGAPDYTVAAIEKQKRGLKEFLNRLAAIDIKDWPISQQVDYYLVRAEMNGMEFYQRIYKPWSRDPVFYLPSQGGAGPVMEIDLWIRSDDLPLTGEKLGEFRKNLLAIPKIYKQAEENLTEAAHDLAKIAIHYIDREASRYERLASRLADHHPDVVPLCKQAQDAVINYGKWLEANISRMTAPAGVGVENYNWYLKNVHLFPYTWEECQLIVEHEYSRIITFLKLEEQRNRDLPPLEVADTAEEYYRRLDEALVYVLQFLRDAEIMTVPDWLDPSDYSDPDDKTRSLPTSPSIDHKAREREVLPGETHEFIGHLFDEQRLERDDRPIRGVRHHYNMDWIRSEGWAAGLEELLMQAGVLDERPRRGREIEYLMNASHMSLSLPDFKMHSNEITFDEARRLCAELMPYGWSHEDEPMVWYEQQSNLRFPGFHTGVVMGKAQLMKLFKDRAMQLGDKFVLREFIDEFLAAGMIPFSLIRWEMTGYEDEIQKLW